ncbi:MAG: urea transport system ATP-binding protein [Alteromonas macleodii]|jgi:urea transport system ATP-binding protein
MLKAENINLYYGASQALSNVSLTAQKGEITCVLGRNGVGKTSLMQSISGRHLAKTGTVTWEGCDISRLSAAERAQGGIAYVPQGRQIFSQLTVLENMKTGFAVLPRSERKIPDEIFDLFPVLRKMLGRRGGDLSGGQQQQLSIARALIMKPRLLILDEPTEGIQPSIIKDIHKVITILKQQGEMAILLVEQYFEFARDLGDKYSVMDRGEIVLGGDIADMNEAEVRKFLTV